MIPFLLAIGAVIAFGFFIVGGYTRDWLMFWVGVAGVAVDAYLWTHFLIKMFRL